MINNEDARELLDAIEGYGDRERIYGAYDSLQARGGATNSEVGERNRDADMALIEVKRLLRPFLDDPDGPHGMFDVPERGDVEPEVEDFHQDEVKWMFEK